MTGSGGAYFSALVCVCVCVCVCVRERERERERSLPFCSVSLDPSLLLFLFSTSHPLHLDHFFLFHRPCLFLVTFLIFFPHQVHVPPFLFLSALPHLGQLSLPPPRVWLFASIAHCPPSPAPSLLTSPVPPPSFPASHAQLLCSSSCFLPSVLPSQLRLPLLVSIAHRPRTIFLTFSLLVKATLHLSCLSQFLSLSPAFLSL